MHLAHARDGDGGGVRALADGVVLARLDVDDDVALRQRAPHRLLDGVGGGVPLADAPRPAGTPMTTSAKCRPAAWRSRSRRRSTGGSMLGDRLARRLVRLARRAVHEHVDVARISRPAATSTSTATNSAAGESPRVARPPRAGARRGRRSTRRGRCRSGARSTAARGCDSGARCAARRPCGSRRSRSRPEHDGTPSQAASTSGSPPPVSRATASAGDERGSATTRIVASASAARCSAFPCPYWWAASAGRTGDADGEEGEQRGDEVGRGVHRLREQAEGPLASPVPSLSAISADAATTETSAVRRCGFIAGVYARSSRQRTTSWRVEKWASGAAAGRSIPSGVIVVRSSSSSAAWSGQGAWWISARYSVPRCEA